jgi:HD-GYP domain-containing protein (c-di-GMP phosphodiesterase class II)
MALERSRGVFDVLREMAWPTVANLPFGLVALLVAILYQQGGIAAAGFILAPLFVLRGARQGKVELDRAQERTLRAFVRAVELKDPYTSRHSERVATITVELHRALGAREERLERRYYGALMHDIGKVGVASHILTKPGRLTPEEFETIQRHPGTSAFVVGGVRFLQDLVPEVLHHHERMDGRGYPSGLAGDQIPFEARVLAVADTFEALTSDRPYRNALTHLEALREIERSSGSQLDPIPVRALRDLLREGHIFPALPSRSQAPVEPRLVAAKEA